MRLRRSQVAYAPAVDYSAYYAPTVSYYAPAVSYASYYTPTVSYYAPAASCGSCGSCSSCAPCSSCALVRRADRKLLCSGRVLCGVLHAGRELLCPGRVLCVVLHADGELLCSGDIRVVLHAVYELLYTVFDILCRLRAVRRGRVEYVRDGQGLRAGRARAQCSACRNTVGRIGVILRFFVGCVKRTTTGSGWCVSRTLRMACREDAQAAPQGLAKSPSGSVAGFGLPMAIAHAVAWVRQ